MPDCPRWLACRPALAITCRPIRGFAIQGNAVAAPKRNQFLPNVPTVAEQGIKDVDITSFIAWFGPAGMNPAVVARINAALVEALAQPVAQQHFNESAYTAESSSPEMLASDVRQAYDNWGRLVKAAGIQKQ